MDKMVLIHGTYITEQEHIFGSKEKIKKFDSKFLNEDGDFSGEKFVHYLEQEGSKVPYDSHQHKIGTLPSYYDETKIKRAQEFFKKHFASMLYAKLAGLVAILAHPNAIKLMIMTNRSNEPKTAYVRYLRTLEHILKWYQSDFIEDFDLWKSISRIKSMHRAANANAKRTSNVPQITQYELSGTVFGFVGFIITKPENFGIVTATDEDIDALVHFWRIIGFLMGVEDRFNMCRETLEETKEIFMAFSNIKLKYYLELKDSNSMRMQFTAIKGISLILIPIKPKALINYIYGLVCSPEKDSNIYFKLNLMESFFGFILSSLAKLLTYGWFKWCINSIIGWKLKFSF